MVPLSCTVRSCGSPLGRRDRAYVCPRGHAYDIARSGYVNLLQPQDRRSLAAGDSAASLEARARLLEKGIGRASIDGFVERAATIDLPSDAVVVELGSGAGDALGGLARTKPISGIGIDLSTAAAERAARRFPALTWVVANADRRLPLLDESVALVLSLHARRNASECARVLATGGTLLVAVPTADDLIELRAVVQGERVERDRAEALLGEHEPYFVLQERSTVRERRRLDRDALLELLKGTYRGARASAAERVAALDSLDVTMASEIFRFTRRAAA